MANLGCPAKQSDSQGKNVKIPLKKWQTNGRIKLQVEVKVIPHCPFWVFPIVNAVSKKSSLSHPFENTITNLAFSLQEAKKRRLLQDTVPQLISGKQHKKRRL